MAPGLTDSGKHEQKSVIVLCIEWSWIRSVFSCVRQSDIFDMFNARLCNCWYVFMLHAGNFCGNSSIHQITSPLRQLHCLNLANGANGRVLTLKWVCKMTSPSIFCSQKTRLWFSKLWCNAKFCKWTCWTVCFILFDCLLLVYDGYQIRQFSHCIAVWRVV